MYFVSLFIFIISDSDFQFLSDSLTEITKFLKKHKYRPPRKISADLIQMRKNT